MIIQHNIPALNAHRQLGINNSSLSKNLEKLSSGYRINRAADDAAGLAISEKMRAQITGLNRAVLNAQDGSSLIQTAEGGLQEVHSMLNRMVELATQSANGTIQADDRQKIEAEVKALKEEIDRVSQATNFNSIKLLDGSLGAKNIDNMQIAGLGAGTTTAATQGTSTLTFANPAVAAVRGDQVSYTIALSDGTSQNIDFTVDGSLNLVAKDGTVYANAAAGAPQGVDLAKAVAAEANKIGSLTSGFSIAAAGTNVTFTARVGGSNGASITAIGGKVGAATENPALANTAGLDETKGYTVTAFDGTNLDAATFSVNGVKFVAATAATAKLITDKNINVILVSADPPVGADYAAIAHTVASKTGVKVDNITQAGVVNQTSLIFHSEAAKGLTMQVGDTADAYNKVTVKVDNMSATGLGIQNISMATQESADAALTAVKAAIEKVSVNRGNLGALQNRLEHTINNLNVSSENMTAAESRIRDVDMAKEMMNFTKNNVLAQAAQAMLAQANQQPQQVLQLLK